LLTKLEPVETDGITALAVEYLNPGNPPMGIKPDDIWNMIGCAEGLSRMRANADALIALATYAQHWNLNEGAIVAEPNVARWDGLAASRGGNWARHDMRLR
jgi:hypothetical protein